MHRWPRPNIRSLFAAALILACSAGEVHPATSFETHPLGWRAGASVGFGLSLPRTCDRCPSASGRGLTFGLEVSAPVVRTLALTLAAEARLLGYERRATSTLSDVSLALQLWPDWGRLEGGNLWLKAGGAFASLATSLGDEINEDTGRVVQFRRLGAAAMFGAGYEVNHAGPWAFELACKGIVGFFADAPALSLLLALGVMWH